MPDTKGYTWLVEPKDTATNEIIMDMPGTEVEGVLECDDKKPHRLLRVVGHADVNALRRSLKPFRQKINIFCRLDMGIPKVIGADWWTARQAPGSKQEKVQKERTGKK